MAVAEFAEVEALIARYATHHPHCAHVQRGDDRPCNCWRGRALQVIKYGVQN